MTSFLRYAAFFRQRRFLLYSLLLAAFFMLYRVSYVDLIGDDAHYTLRAIGYVDMMFSDKQTTPLNWFESYPWWANLSFHDHPLLLFFVQHIFLSVHESIFFAKLPCILFSLGSLVILYQWMDFEQGKRLASWSVLFLSVNALFIGISRTAYLEAGLIFFVLLALYYSSRFFHDQRYWWKFGVALGLCLLSKYTSFFLVPGIFLYYALRKRRLFKDKKLYYAIGMALLSWSPSIIYNVMMYKSTGHFDYQFSRLFGMDSPWKVGGLDSGSFTSGLLSQASVLGSLISFPYLFIALCGAAYALFKRNLGLIIISMLFLGIQYAFTGYSAWHLSLFAPFLAVCASYALTVLYDFTGRFHYGAIVHTFILVPFFVVYFLFFLLNSLLARPFVLGPEGWFTPRVIGKNVGLYQLDRYLDKLIEDHGISDIRDGYQKLKAKKPSLQAYASSQEALKKPQNVFEHMIVYDENLNWFAQLWPFMRRRFYHNMPILSTKELPAYIHDISIKNLYFIKATEDSYLEGESLLKSLSLETERELQEKGIVPDAIYNSVGEIAFKVYAISSEE